MDMIMTGMSGLETVKKMRSIAGREATPVLFQTSYRNDDLLDELAQVGQGLIAKPVSEKELIQKMQQFFVPKETSCEKYHALIFSTSDEVEKLLTQVAKKFHWGLTFIKNSFEASFFLRSRQFHLVIADVQNGNIESMEFAQLVLQTHSDLNLLVLKDSTMDAQLLNNVGVRNIVVAPFEENDFTNYFSPEVFESLSISLEDEKFKILLADDSEDAIVLIKAFLGKTDVEVIAVESGDHAYELFQKDYFDLVLLDYEMSQGNGPSTAKKIREFEKAFSRKPTPLWVLTAHGDAGEAEKSRAAGFDLFLSKPIHKDDLLGRIKKLRDGQNS